MINESLNYILNNVIFLFEVQKKYESKNSKVVKTKNGRIMLLSKCAKLEFIKEQEARGLLIKLTVIKLPILSDLPIANILF